jgi:hypothetical protein
MEIQPVYSKSSNLSQSAELSNWFSFILGAYVAQDKQCQNSSLPRQQGRPEKTSRGLEVRGESHVSQDISPHGTSKRDSKSSRPCIYSCCPCCPCCGRAQAEALSFRAWLIDSVELFRSLGTSSSFLSAQLNHCKALKFS